MLSNSASDSSAMVFPSFGVGKACMTTFHVGGGWIVCILALLHYDCSQNGSSLLFLSRHCFNLTILLIPPREADCLIRSR